MTRRVQELVYGTMASYQSMNAKDKKQAILNLKFKLLTSDALAYPDHVRAAHIFLRIIRKDL
jgi:hypothetical protein